MDSGDGRPGFEEARDELIELVKRLEAGGLTLEQSLQLWERGEQLATICEDWLEGARARMAEGGPGGLPPGKASAMSRDDPPTAEPSAPF